MKRPKYFTALLLGGFCFCAGITVSSGEEPGAKPAESATLDHLAKIPASEFAKIIENSISPNKRLAVALGSPDGKKPKWNEDTYEGRGGAVERSFFLERCRNYVIDVKADRVTGILDGRHFGTRSNYNHESSHIVWSPDSRWLVETRSWKWHTETCTVHRLGAEGQLAGRLNYRKAADEIVDTWLREHWPKLTEEQRSRYAVTVSVESVSNDGSLIAGISAEIPKDEDAEYVSVSVSAKVEQAKDGELSMQVSKVASRQ